MSLFIILVLGTFLRIIGLNNLSFWHDEAFFAAISQNFSWAEMLSQVSASIHPPLYFALMKIWGAIFGNTEIALRSLSIVFGVLSIWIGYRLVREFLINRADELKLAGLLVAVLLAINPVLISSSMQATSFALALFLVLWATYLLLKALRENKREQWILYGLILAFAAYTHYLVFIPLFIHLLYLIYRIRITRIYLAPLGSWVLALLIFLPWIPTFWQQITSTPASILTPSIETPLVLLIPLAIAVIFLLYLFSRLLSEQSRWLIIFLSLVPYLIFAEPFLSIVITVLLLNIPWAKTRRIAIVLFVLLNLVIYGAELINFSQEKNPGMRAAAEFVNERVTETDRVLLGSKFVDYSFQYYNDSNIEPKLILGQEAFEQVETKSNDTVWLIWTTGFEETKPNVPGNWKVVEETKFTDTPEFKGDVIVTQYLIQE